MSGAGVGERRAEARLPLDAPVVLSARAGEVRGRSRDVSISGLLVELWEPLTFLEHQVGVSVELPSGEVVDREADIVRRAVSETGSILIALRFCDSPNGRALVRRAGTRPLRDYSKRLRPSRAQPREVDLTLVRGELRAAGAQALELAFEDPDADPPEATVRWVASLAGQLGRPAPAAVTARGLVHAIADLHRRIPAGDDADL
ncbi:MAG: PilZ domain-containing protein [Thermoleophilia bacterium]